MGASQSGLYIPSGILTGTAYEARDVICSAFKIEYAVGSVGAVPYNTKLIDIASANATMRVHLYAAQPTGKTIGAAWALADVDENYYLGYIDHSTWVSAGASKMIAQTDRPAVGLWSSANGRHVWGEIEMPAGGTFGNSANPLRFGMFTVRDH